MTESLVLYSALVFGTALFGGIIPLLWRKVREDSLKIFVCFGAGLLLGMSFLHMIPEAAEILPHRFGYWFLIGFLVLLILEWAIRE